jgi:hypothetical protein
MRHSARAAVAGVIALSVMMLMAPAARAETAYRYWTYWAVNDGSWMFETIGPASNVPVDGSVEGWRFAVTSAAGRAENAPTSVAADTAFIDLCGSTESVPGMKRIALVVDFGMPADAPPGERQPVGINECVVADTGASGYEVLRSIADVRVKDGLICGIDSYPLVECAEMVDPNALAANTDSATSTVTDAIMPTSASSGSPTGPLVSALVILLVAGIGYFAWRGRKT